MSVDSEIRSSVAHGNSERFAVAIDFVSDADRDDMRASDLRTSWADFKIWIDGRNLCEHEVYGERRPAVRWYVLPLLEWLTEMWDPLLHEERIPGREQGVAAASAMRELNQVEPADDDAIVEWFAAQQLWLGRHSVQAAREGGEFPALFIRRRRARVELSWDERHAQQGSDSPLFVEASAGHGLVDPLEAAKVLHSVLRDSAEALRHMDGSSPRIGSLNESVQGLATRARAEDRLAWLAGLGHTWDEILEKWRQVSHVAAGAITNASEAARRSVVGDLGDPLVVGGHCRAPLLFGSMSPSLTAADVRTMARKLVDAYDPAPDRPELDGLAHSIDVVDAPWKHGYHLAERLHEELQIDTGNPVDVQSILTRLRVDLDRIRLSDDGARAVSMLSPEHRATVLVNRNYQLNERDEVYRYTLAHELCHLVYDREQGSELALTSGPWAPREIEQRADAFAAMFLMPRSLVRRSIARSHLPPSELDGVRLIARAMATSMTTTIEHLHNLGEIDVVERDRLLQELSFQVDNGRRRRR
jgi:Zn-dependent peptidase ImmA (M78 family)